ncbi:hypothetical protein DOTSEDRAFT_165775 [Dothistroma septosporum NZE10]|uniref:T6SS Phospholipase effector Tle1-like catalytic domain-containing protein n=1 Tax=Dothistroma septosporum (strain NZE10 / CBS 128990) TaxID=675120 RepID=N1PVS1_DOTSN|nr:hypothetical protein DOTSEDRAFT_165775 [Dothistroma septosporum NZE10]
MVKRIIVAVDGTWVNSDNGYVESDPSKPCLATPSNVTRLCRALEARSSDGIEQIVYYQGGLGTAGNWYSYNIGGYLGSGIDEAMRQAYGFICNNYEDGDEITLIGFSRGAFTARSVGGLLSSVGVLTKMGMDSFYPIFKDWENQNNKDYKSSYSTPDWTIQGRPKTFENGAYMKALAAAGLTRANVPVKAVAVFDTVGSLGIPDLHLAGFKLYTGSKSEYSFVNTQVAPNVEHAYQALALDERRGAFSPTVWESPRSNTDKHILKELKQTWFSGVHTSIGGGYKDTSIADITLAWMMEQLSKHLEFYRPYLGYQITQNQKFYEDKNTPQKGRGWGLGLIQDNSTGFLNMIQGTASRTPGEYHLTDPDTGNDLPERLRNTCEFIHPSVRYRMDKGTSLTTSADQKVGQHDYRSQALSSANWEYFAPGQEVVGAQIDPKWAKAAKWVKKDTKTYIVEDKINAEGYERILTDSWEGVNTFIGLRELLDGAGHHTSASGIFHPPTRTFT